MNQLIINARESKKRIAVIEKGKLKYFYTEHPDHVSLVGNIYLGVVEKVVPSMNAAFIHIGKGKTGYLHLSQVPTYSLSRDEKKNMKLISRFIHQGEKIIVQVIKDETDSKYYRLTGNIEVLGETMVYMPFGQYVAVSKKISEESRTKLRNWANKHVNEDEGVVIRTIANTKKELELEEELDRLREEFLRIQKLSYTVKAPAALSIKDTFFEMIERYLEKIDVAEIFSDDLKIYQDLKEQIKTGPSNLHFFKGKENIFSHFHIEEGTDHLQRKLVWLENGGNIVIEETEACTIIDVNTGKFTGNVQREKAVMETNILASIEIATQIRLRNISGIILIDFINMKEEKNRQEIINILKKEFQNDLERATIYGFTNLGILELARKRTHPSLRQQEEIVCPVCNGTGSVLSPEAVAFQMERELWQYKGSDYQKMIIEATEDVILYFKGEDQSFFNHLKETLHIDLEFVLIDFQKPHYHIKRMV